MNSLQDIPGGKSNCRQPGILIVADHLRNVLIPDEMVRVVQGQIERTSKEYPYLFEFIWKPNRAFESTLRRAGIEKKTPQGKLTIHSFRATYLSKMSESLNNNPWLLKEIAGHKNIRTTEVYCQPTAPVIPISMLHLMPRTPEEVRADGQMGVNAGCK